jgi:4,5-dihydroxyphthalate decarboxylase
MSVTTDERVTTLSAAFDDYPHTLPLKRGEVRSPRLSLAFSDIKPANRFFKPMVRELKFDVSEMAVGTFVQAKAYGKPLVLLPATMMGRFQQGTILCRASHPVRPHELPGKRVGVRSYSQTTVLWVRGILQNDYGVDINRIRWVTQEDGHVAEYREPAGTERVAADKNLLTMLREGEIDAAIYGANLPKDDPTLTTVIPDAEAAALAWFAKHKVVPINHMVVVTEKLAKSNPEAVREVYRLLVASKAAGAPKAGAIDFLPFGLEACKPALETIVNYSLQQKLIGRKIDVAELFDDTTRALGA